MNRSSLKLIAVAMPALFSTAALAQITIDVTPTLAPNAFGSPSWATWVSNTTYAMQNGLTSYGTPGTPTYFSAQTGPVDRRSVIVTGFNSWLGDADPGTTYGAAFANELGNRMHFALHIMGNGTRFALADLSFVGTSTGDSNGLGFGFNAGDYNYSTSYVGIDYGTDGLRGTSDDVMITSGANTQLVDELVGRGSGNSYAAYTSDPGATNQDKLNGIADDPANAWNTFTGVYSLGGVTGSGSFSAVPEPGTIAVLGLGIAALVRKRRAR